MIPIAKRAGGWSDILSMVILPFLILGILEIIIGFYLIFVKKIYELITTYIGVIYSLIGFFYIFYFYYFSLTFIIPGIILIVVGVKPEFRFFGKKINEKNEYS